MTFQPATSSAIALYDGITGKVIKNSTVTIDGSGNIVTTGTLNVGNVTGGTYNGITVAAHAARHAPTGPDALGTAAVVWQPYNPNSGAL